MRDSDGTKKDKGRSAQGGVGRAAWRRANRNDLCASDIVGWADRVILKSKRGVRGRGQSRINPPMLVLILTLTMLAASVAFFCIYK